MNNSKYNFKAGDTHPQITFRPAENQEFVSVPSGVSATFTVVDREAGVSLIENQSATVEQTGPLVMSYTFGPGETDTVGDYSAEFELTFQDGGTRTFPDTEYIPISIHPELSAQGPVSVGPTRHDVTVGTLDAQSINTDELLVNKRMVVPSVQTVSDLPSDANSTDTQVMFVESEQRYYRFNTQA